jgi:UDP-3-O-[3-hydroxymyristoyl] glucosamine N-acyltransferase
MSPRGFILAELAQRVGGAVQGNAALRLSGVAPLDSASPEQIAYFNHPAYAEAFARTRAGAVIVAAQLAAAHPQKTLLVAQDPALAFAGVARAFHPESEVVAGRSAQAFVHPSAEVDPSACLEPFACVAAGARVGPRCGLASFSFVGEGAQLGPDCRLHVGAKVMHGCVLGARVVLQPGAVVGADGFGYAFDSVQGEHLKIPQTGIAVLEEDVELGANSCVDRATLGETRVGRGSKLDNLVQVGHNVLIGPQSILCGQVGIAGSATLGQGVVLGGQAAVADHRSIGAGAKLAGRSGVTRDIPAGETWAGFPAQPRRDWLRNVAAAGELAELSAEVRRLRAELSRLTAKK